MPVSKTMRFDDDVLSVLREMEIQTNDDLFVGKLTGQLDRKMYEKVNKAIEALGGKWNRGKKGHIFKDDPRLKIEGFLENGEITVEKYGWFPTPEDVVQQMLEVVPLPEGSCNIMEPSAGEGHIVQVLIKNGANPKNIFAVELNEERARHLESNFDCWVSQQDFMKIGAGGKRVAFHRVYMNPPFEGGQDIEHVMHAYEFLAPSGKMAAIMSEGPFFRNDRKAEDFRTWLEEVGGCSKTLPAGAFKSSGTGVSTRLVWITK